MNPNPDDPDRLDDDIVEYLNDALVPEPVNAATTARIKHRLLERIAEDQRSRHLTVRPGDGHWRPFGPGLQIKLLHDAGEIWSYLLKLAPGARLPSHRHPVDEECVVLEGDVWVGDQRVAAGGFHLGRQDVLHAPITTVDGATLFLRGARPEAGHLI
jgi:anti-sigma factor ChrR (cupin superfamily)